MLACLDPDRNAGDPPDGHQARQEDRRDPKSAAARKPAAAAPAAKKATAPKAAAVKAPAKKTAAVKRAVKKPAPAKSAEAVRAETIARKSLRKPSAPGVEELRFGIESAFERRATLTLHELEGSTRPLVNRVIDGLESGEFRVAEPDGQGGWKVNEWLKKAVLLYFRVNDMAVVDARPAPFWDSSRIALRRLRRSEVPPERRVVPGAIARRGSYFGKDVVLMPSFTNIGAYVGEGTMVDTWATVGSCAQIGKHCHLSGGAGIGGVLEPLQASPTIIEDHCFIGARSEVVEGVVVGHHSVIGMGVFSARAPASTTAPPARSATATSRRTAWWCPARCRARTVPTRCTAR